MCKVGDYILDINNIEKICTQTNTQKRSTQKTDDSIANNRKKQKITESEVKNEKCEVKNEVSAEEIKDNIIRYGLPEDATDDVKEVAKQMEKEEVVAQEEEQHYHRGR